jgi:cell division protein FtsQ
MKPPRADPGGAVVHPDRLARRRREVLREARRAAARRRRRRLLAVLTLATVGTGAGLLARSPLLALDGVEVVGTRLLADREVLEASGLRPGQSLLTVDGREVAARLRRLPLVAQASVVRVGVARVRIVVRERRPAFVLETTEGRWLMDGSGVLLVAAEGATARGLPTIRLPASAADTGDRVRAPALRLALELFSSLPEWLREPVPTLDMAGPGGIELLRPGLRVVFGTPDRMAEKIEAVRLVLDRARQTRERIASVDVRAPTRPAALLD